MQAIERTLTSNEVAEMVGKEHKNLVRDIRTYIGYLGEVKIEPSSFFIESTYVNEQNKVQPNYLLTKQGCEMVSNKLTGAKGVQFTAKYVSRFNEMEQHIAQPFNVPQSLPEALRLAAELEEERQVLETKIKEDAPFTAFGKIVENSEGAINIGEFAKILYEKDGINLGRNKLLEWLRDRGYLIKNGKERNNPKQQYLEQGLFVSRTTVIARTEGQMQASTTMITGKGQIRITSELKAEVEAKNRVFS